MAVIETAAEIAKALRKRADQIGDLLSDPPQPHPDAALMRQAADVLEVFDTTVNAERVRSATIAAQHDRYAHWLLFVGANPDNPGEKLNRAAERLIRIEAERGYRAAIEEWHRMTKL